MQVHAGPCRSMQVHAGPCMFFCFSCAKWVCSRDVRVSYIRLLVSCIQLNFHHPTKYSMGFPPRPFIETCKHILSTGAQIRTHGTRGENLGKSTSQSTGTPHYHITNCSSKKSIPSELLTFVSLFNYEI